MSEITHLSAAALAARIRGGRLTSADAVEAYLARIAAVDARVGAYVRVLSERARTQARALDAEISSGRLRGPLHGVPVAIKDLFAIEGVPMAAGSSFLVEPSRETATVVQRLEAAGAIVLGTTTLHEFALGMTSVNPHGPSPRNPWHLDRITGGSSGGSAAAVAAGLAAGAIGSDTGGSIRIPGALSGIVGLKPTFGRVSRHGVLPLARSFDTVGPMVRTVEDAALFLEATAGSDEADPHSAPAPVGRYAQEMTQLPSGLRIGRLSGPHFDDDVDPAVSRALDEATRWLAASGASVHPVLLQNFEAGHRAQVTLLLAEAGTFHRGAFPGHEREYGLDVRRLLEQGASTPAAELDAARAAMGQLQAEVATLLTNYPVLLGPAMQAGAPRIADVDPAGERWPEIRRVLGRFSRLYNATGLPAIVIPADLDTDGLPVAVQLAAGPFQEGLLLAVARRLEQEIGWSLPELPRAAA
ncbi:MAG: amidase [bacterium]